MPTDLHGLITRVLSRYSKSSPRLLKLLGPSSPYAIISIFQRGTTISAKHFINHGSSAEDGATQATLKATAQILVAEAHRAPEARFATSIQHQKQSVVTKVTTTDGLVIVICLCGASNLTGASALDNEILDYLIYEACLCMV